MKLIVDTHVHTVASDHAFSTILEDIEYAKKNGMKAIAITDHAHRMTDGAHRYHFWNLKVVPEKVNGIRIFKGAEGNIMDNFGKLDIEESDDYDDLDIIIASIHSSVMEPQDFEYHTETYINTIKNPRVNIIGHPDDRKYQYDMEKVIKTAKEYNKAIEINNSSINIGRAEPNTIETILKLCKENKVFISCGSDAHFALDVGNFSNILPLFNKVDFPEELILNTSIEKMEKFLLNNKD